MSSSTIDNLENRFRSGWLCEEIVNSVGRRELISCFPRTRPRGKTVEIGSREVVNSTNVRRFLVPNRGIDQQDAGETAPHLGYHHSMVEIHCSRPRLPHQKCCIWSDHRCQPS